MSNSNNLSLDESKEQQEEREKMRVLVSNFSEEQLNRYEIYRRASLPKSSVRRMVQSLINCPVSSDAVIAISGIAKVFAGELVEEAIVVMTSLGESGPIQPKHLREALRRLRRRGGGW